MNPENFLKYKPIEDYGIIGDLRTVALVGMDGSIDWCCFPHFDSPSIFAALLDAERGGYFRIHAIDKVRRKQLYIPDTNVLVTRFLSRGGVGEIQDFMPISNSERSRLEGKHRIVRRVTTVRGKMRFRLECYPGFNYGRDSHTVELDERGVIFRSKAQELALLSPVEIKIEAQGVVAEFVLSEGETLTFVLKPHEEGRLMHYPDEQMDQGYLETVQFWKRWLSQCTYQGRWREMVHRSALVLKLLTYEPTGAIIAAPTTSLPEELGGARNWDYRYTWIRDACFTLYGFMRVGFKDEAAAFMRWLEKRLHELKPGEPLALMYTIHGKPDIPEQELEHLEGYMGSGPVRIGNGAAGQLQLDIYGALLDAVYLYDKYTEQLPYDMWQSIRGLLDWVCDNWDQPDEGIWEVRGGRKHFVYSKVMCWVALDRGIRLARKRSYPGDRPHWEKARDTIYLEVMEKGWDKNLKSFVQSYDSKALDASNLIMSLVFFMSPRDPRILRTLDAIQRELASDSLVYRYKQEHSPDGIDGAEGTFSLCTFWLAEALARSGRLEEARMTFDKMLGYANHLGLYSEEIGPSGEALGNFPQAFTHLGLISAAFAIDRALDQGGVS